MKTVSVIIPAYNEATYIDRLLKALTKQNFKDFEVIVSDAQSKDGTKEVVDNYKDKLDIKFIESPPRGPGAGRNKGAEVASGDWLLFLDADNVIEDTDFINTLLSGAQTRDWQTAASKYKVLNPTFAERLGMGFINYQYLKLLSRTKKPVAPGYCILTKRNLFEKNGGFNEKIQFGEDYDYITRTAKAGFGFVEETHYLVDMRRSREEGSLKLFIKGLLNEIYRHLPGYSLEKNPVKYEFGKHKKRK